ncbi:MAG: ATP-dependent helicase HrpB [Pseudomonadales bacterium]|nr:ATP-dependent helicase HrpB [Pseudomonadales bacterium]
MTLPIESVLPNIIQQITNHDSLVVQAPPGAGKTTMIPLALLKAGIVHGKILLIQPRRLAVYGAAMRMANLLKQPIGEQVGFTTRFDSKKSAATKIEVITEGIFLRKIQQDPELEGIGLIIFDEFHERSVTNDLGLAFAIESQQAYREADQPLKLMVMSATLNGEALADWLDAPIALSEGRQFPVETFYRPLPAQSNIILHVTQLVQEALNNSSGSLLVFLPGMKEINRVNDRLKELSLADHVTIFPLHASLPTDQQQKAIEKPSEGQRKIVLTTNVAETSITIEGIDTVVDSGLVRVSVYDERRCMNVLVTEKISAASAEQRRGRAGRLQAGFCYRAWNESAQNQLKAYSDPEMLRTDLLPVALEFATWGCQNSNDLMLLTHPNASALARAQESLHEMGALDTNHVITAAGSQVAKLGLHPRLALLIQNSRDLNCENAAIASAAILSEGDPLRFHQQWPQSDLSLRFDLFESKKSIAELHHATWKRITQLCQQLSKRASIYWDKKPIDDANISEALAKAFPEHIAQQRQNAEHRYLMANGKGVKLNPEDNLIGTPYLIVLDASGNEQEPFIRLALPISQEQLTIAMKAHLTQQDLVHWDAKRNQVEANHVVAFKTLQIEKSKLSQVDPEQITQCLLEHIQRIGIEYLNWDTAANNLKQRVNWLHQQQPDQWPNWSKDTLTDNLEQWLGPFVAGINKLSDVEKLPLVDPLRAYLGWDKLTTLDQLAPEHWALPTGSQRNIEYSEENGPTLRARMQELYSTKEHPTLKDGTPILIELRSPADRPIQLTKDLVQFWQGSYQEVAKEMRGRYPKHYWPEDPANANATTKTKKHM